MISQQSIQNILDASVIEEVIGDFVSLKKRGSNYIGLCPFHNEKTPSFSVSASKGIFKCFGCGEGGNVVNFLMRHEHYNYPEALRVLAQRYQVDIEEDETDEDYQIRKDEQEGMYNMLNFAQKYFQNNLWESDLGKAIGLSYFLDRGLRENTIQKFGLGYSPEASTALTEHAQRNGYNNELLEKSGLSIKSSNNSNYFDRFKGRVMFPIHNLTGRVIGFGGRILKTDKKLAKYINSPETEIYNKSKVLYGFYFAKNAIVKQDLCYLVEGYTDVISMVQAGVENVVASSGTSLTVDQIRLIKRYTKNITILYDGDAAGIKASFRGVDLILEEGMDVKIVPFAEGEDPDTYAQKHTATELLEFLDRNTLNFILYKAKLLSKESESDPIKKAKMISEIVETISLIPDAIRRSIYIKECSELVKIPEKSLNQEVRKIRYKKYSNTTFKKPEVGPEKTEQAKEYQLVQTDDLKEAEKQLIKLMLNYGDRKLQIEDEEYSIAGYCIEEIDEDELLFSSVAYQDIYNHIKNKLKQNEVIKVASLMMHQDEFIRKEVLEMSGEKHSLSPNWKDKLEVFVKLESDDIILYQLVQDLLANFKLKSLRKSIEDMQKQNVDEELSTEDGMIMLEKMKLMNQLKKQYTKMLGRFILG